MPATLTLFALELLNFGLQTVVRKNFEMFTHDILDDVDPQKTHIGELDSDPKVASLDACIRNLRQVFARHGLKLRLKPAARKCLHARARSAGEVWQVLQDNVGAPLARMIQAGEVAEGNTVVIDCIMDDIVFRVY